MSREIDPQKIADGTLDEDEVRYLQDRNQLPEDYEPAENKLSEPTPLEEVPNTGDASTEEPEADEETAKARTNAASEDGFETETSDEEVEEVETEEDYDEGWNNDDRRAELSKRGLSIDGTKQELIQRLIEDDQSK